MKVLLFFTLLTPLFSLAKDKKRMNIQIKYKDKVIKILLKNNSTAQALYNQLPLTMKFEDYASHEKVFYPPKKLSTKDSPEGYKPTKGDVTYYAPWGNVAIFYKDFSYSKGLIKLGVIVEGADYLELLEGTEAKIEAIDN